MNEFLLANWEALTSEKPALQKRFLNELEALYNAENRHYHTLTHVEALLHYVDKYSHLLSDPNTLRFSIWYHDAIYNAAKQNNEEKSAELATSHLTELGLPARQITVIHNLIKATKHHQLPSAMDYFDSRFLIDIDLSILAVSRTKYVLYTRQIRKEYKLFPSIIYKPGRRKVLRQFLEMKNIYKTDLFQKEWEEKARENLKYELETLGV